MKRTSNVTHLIPSYCSIHIDHEWIIIPFSPDLGMLVHQSWIKFEPLIGQVCHKNTASPSTEQWWFTVQARHVRVDLVQGCWSTCAPSMVRDQPSMHGGTRTGHLLVQQKRTTDGTANRWYKSGSLAGGPSKMLHRRNSKYIAISYHLQQFRFRIPSWMLMGKEMRAPWWGIVNKCLLQDSWANLWNKLLD